MFYREDIRAFVRRELMLIIAFVVLVILTVIYPGRVKEYPHFIDWRTILSLTGLMAITIGMRESGIYNHLSVSILRRLKTERQLSIFFVVFSSFLSTFLTNDITLFIVVPLTVCVLKGLDNDLGKLIIFEAISVNVGSSLTPIGNPQNLFLWHSWGVSFFYFMYRMMPMFLVSMVLLLFMTYISFSNRRINRQSKDLERDRVDYKLFYLSVFLLFVFILLIEKGLVLEGLVLVILVYLMFYRKIIGKIDWLLLLFFVLVFIDLRVISRIEQIDNLVRTVDLGTGRSVFLFSVLVSQIISNVPASVFVHHFTHNYLALAYGVNVGGNGLIIGSLANFIALRLSPDKKLIVKFHEYSIPFLIASVVIIYFLFF